MSYDVRANLSGNFMPLSVNVYGFKFIQNVAYRRTEEQQLSAMNIHVGFFLSIVYESTEKYGKLHCKLTQVRN